MTTLVLATRNTKKLAELRRILDEAGLEVDLAGPEVFAQLPDIPETGATFAENAVEKARAVAAATGLPAVADDSGLCVDALNGMPGILSARWAGRHGDDEANLDLVLGQLADLPDDRRGAQFVCAAALALPSGDAAVVTGEIRGVLLRERRGTNGFGYDPIFRPDGYDVTTAEMGPADKDAISHRGKALRALVPHIAARLADSGGSPG